MDKKILQLDFGNLVENLRKNDLKLILLKDKIGMFIQDTNNNIYEIETYWLGSYLDKMIKNKATVLFNLIDKNMINNFEKEIFTWKDIQNFIKRNSEIHKEEKLLDQKIDKTNELNEDKPIESLLEKAPKDNREKGYER